MKSAAVAATATAAVVLLGNVECVNATNDELDFNKEPLFVDLIPFSKFSTSGRSIDVCDSTLSHVLASSLSVSDQVFDDVFDLLKEFQAQISNDPLMALKLGNRPKVYLAPPPLSPGDTPDLDDLFHGSDGQNHQPALLYERELEGKDVEDPPAVVVVAAGGKKKADEDPKVIKRDDLVPVWAGLPDVTKLVNLSPDQMVGFLSSRPVGKFLGMTIGRTMIRAYILKMKGNLHVEFNRMDLGTALSHASHQSSKFDGDVVGNMCGLMDALYYGYNCLVPITSFDCSSAEALSFPPLINDDELTIAKTPTLSPLMHLSGRNSMDPKLPYWDFRALMLATRLTSADYCGTFDYAKLGYPKLVPGHTVDLVFKTRQQGSQNSMGMPLSVEKFNFAWVSRRFALSKVLGVKDPMAVKIEGTCDFHILVRDVMTEFERKLQSDMTQSIFAGGPDSRRNRILAHQGASEMANIMFPGLTNYFDNIVKSKTCAAENIRVHLTGHGFGGSIAEILGLSLAYHFDQNYGTNTAEQISMLLFGPMRALNDLGYRELNKRANVVTWVSKYDAIPHLPVVQLRPEGEAVGLPRCESGVNIMGIGKGRDSAYGEHPNIYTIDPAEFVKHTKQWDNFQALDLWTDIFEKPLAAEANLPLPLRLDANHICVYGCKAAQQSGIKTPWMCDEAQCPSLAGGYYYHDLKPLQRQQF